MIQPDEAKRAFDENIKIKKKVNYNLTVAPYYLDYIKYYMRKKYGEDALLTEGYKIYTGVILKYQEMAKYALKKGLEDFEKRRGYSGALEHISKSNLSFALFNSDNASSLDF